MFTLCKAVSKQFEERNHMKPTLLQVPFYLIACALSLTSCSKTPTEPNNEPPNLIANADFEVHSQPSLQNWVVDSNWAALVLDTIAGAPKWCIRIAPGWLPQEGFATTYVTGQSGSGIYKLTVLMRSTGAWQGTISLGRWSQNASSFVKQAGNNSSDWTQVTVTDTINLQTSDSIAVHLSAGSTEVAMGDVYCTDVVLQRIQ